MVIIALLIGLIFASLFVVNMVSIIKKVTDKNEKTALNTFICCLSLMYLWCSLVFLSNL